MSEANSCVKEEVFTRHRMTPKVGPRGVYFLGDIVQCAVAARQGRAVF